MAAEKETVVCACDCMEVCSDSDAANTREKRKSDMVRRFASQFVETPAKVSARWERAIETHNRVKSETITR